MSKELPYFRWYPSDAESDSKYAALSLSELGLFHRCLNLSWMNDGLPSDPLEIGRVLRITPREVKMLWPRVSECFELREGKHCNRRQEQERLHAKGKGDKSTATAASGQKQEPGFIYLAKRNSDGAVKIGSATNVARRIAQIRYKSNDNTISLVTSFPVVNMRQAEIEIHESVSDKRVTGEWYAITVEDLKAITLWGDSYHPKGDIGGDSMGDLKYHPTPPARVRAESGSVSESKDFSSEEILTLIFACFDRHEKYDKREAREVVAQTVFGMSLDWVKLATNHDAFCAHWAGKWRYCSVTFLGWVRNDMPVPTPEKSAGEAGADSIAATLRKEFGLPDK